MTGLIALGIDLGTTYSVASTMVLDSRNNWYPKVLSNPGGKDLTPSVVFFDSNDRSSVVGNDALQIWKEEPNNVIRWVKRKMGDSQYRYIINESRGAEHFSPQQISSFILNYLIRYAKQRAPELELKSVVITIPAFFGDNERQATIDAARLLNLDVVLIEEPTAAILDYLHEKINENNINSSQGNKYYSVFDLGGGTFDISVAQLTWEDQNPIIRIIATEGHRKLGGFDFDLDLTEVTLLKLIDKYPQQRTDLDKVLSGLKELRDTGQVKDFELWAILIDIIDTVENAKIMLSNMSSRKVYIPYSSLFTTLMSIDLTRNDVEKTLEPKLQEMEDRANRALMTAKGNTNGDLDSWDKLDRVIMVGGSTRIPLVRDLVSKLFGKAPALDGREDHTVARGAAIYAGILAGFDIKGKFQRKTVHSYGLLSGNSFNPIINRGTPYPPAKAHLNHSVSFVLSPSTRLKIAQGVSSRNGEEEYEQIKEVEFYHPILYTGDSIKITLNIDQNGLLQIHAEDASGEQVEEKIQSVALSENEELSQKNEIEKWPLKKEEG
ncbi:Hsp70 family protein [Paenibacillus sp. GCM10027626]|uniref:Hsp70 family protein n=1 Tax=Paenibacillus sp. GCM10027626 TaxID=3273411 RepID=UPI0036345112